MDRREFIRNLIASTAVSGLASVPLVPALGTRPAQAQYVEVIVAAIGVIKTIADASRGDGGLGASLSTLNGKLDVAIRQLAAIQKSIEYVVTEIAKLRKDIFDALGEQAAYVIHNEVVTAIQRIQDLMVEAKTRGVSLAADNLNRGDFVDRLKARYENFDIARDKLVNLPEGRSTLPSSVCSICFAIDCAAFGWGIITDVQLSIEANHHVNWLNRMSDPAQQHSVAEAIRIAGVNEAKIISDAKERFEKEGDAASYIAYKVYSGSPADVCVIYNMDAESYAQDGRGWMRTGVTKSILAARFTRDVVDKSGAAFLENIKDVDHIYHHLNPDGTTWLAHPKIGEIDQSKCVRQDLPLYGIDYNHLVRVARSTNPSDLRSWKVLAPVVFQNVRTGSGTLWKEVTSIKAWKDAQLILDQVNLQRLKRAYATACLSHVVEHLSQVRRMKQTLPAVDLTDAVRQ